VVLSRRAHSHSRPSCQSEHLDGTRRLSGTTCTFGSSVNRLGKATDDPLRRTTGPSLRSAEVEMRGAAVWTFRVARAARHAMRILSAGPAGRSHQTPRKSSSTEDLLRCEAGAGRPETASTQTHGSLLEASVVASAPAEIARLSHNQGNCGAHRDLTRRDRDLLGHGKEGHRLESDAGLGSSKGIPAIGSGNKRQPGNIWAAILRALVDGAARGLHV
jgi:hypothetical protein